MSIPPEAGRQGATKYRAAIAGSKPPDAHATSQRGRAAAPPVTGTAPAAHAPAPSSQAAATAGNATAARAAAGSPGGHAAAPGAAEVTLGAPEVERFRRRVWAHDRRHYRSLPWRETNDPYAILVSEVMLQQTQVTRVGNYYGRFLARFPDPDSLAAAPLGAVLELWSGLGYNRRALALQRAAGAVAREHGGVIPADRDALLRLPGVGPATAGALLAFAFARPAVFIETNIRRVFLHQYFPAATTVPDAALLPLVARTLDRRQPRRWYYALMDWGAALGQQRAGNPNRRSAHYSRQSPFAGSRRELRGRVLRLLAERRCLTFAELQDRCADDRLAAVVAELAAEQFLTRSGALVCIAGYPAPPGTAPSGPDAREFTGKDALTRR